MANEEMRIRGVQERHRQAIFEKANVVGVGVGFKESRAKRTEQLSMVVLVKQKLPTGQLRPEDLVPPEIEGVPTDVREVGELWVQQDRRGLWRPAPGGVSIGHFAITAGTLGTLVRDRKSGELLILSNNHVLANSNDAQIGDSILQPGPVDIANFLHQDPNDPQFRIATLERFVSISFSTDVPTCDLARAVADVSNALARALGSTHRLLAYQQNLAAMNEVDAAVARPLDPSALQSDILEVGAVLGNGTKEVGLGAPVEKSGRTTGHLVGTVDLIGVTASVNYAAFPNTRIAQFANQILTGPISQGGDSGSLVVDRATKRAVGLLFAGSDKVTIINPINRVLDLLDIEMG
jgi:hypothetical protein